MDRQYTGLKCKDTNGVIRSCKSKDIQYTGLKCKNTNGVIRRATEINCHSICSDVTDDTIESD
jgi:hypothetical protein